MRPPKRLVRLFGGRQSKGQRGTGDTYSAVRSSFISRDYTNSKSELNSRLEIHHQRDVFQISPEVKEALNARKPVVALETTIYTHGFPYPHNVALALDLESIVRRNGGVPATIGVLDGVAKVGMTTEDLRQIAAAAEDPRTMKVSRRDLPYILGLGLAGRKFSGGTTIAGTMFLARRAGIRVFGTGGLGGVHRGGQDSLDISADLTELGRTSVAVICSGCKSFLDLPRTLEYLETQGVGVSTFADGRTGVIDFPAFYTRDSGVKSPMVVQNEREAAAMIYSQSFFKDPSGLLFANPIPEEFSIPKNEIDSAIDQAVEEAAEQGIRGHANTPFILARIKELTKGNSLPANRALIESNVAMATKVAVELSRFENEDSTITKLDYNAGPENIEHPDQERRSTPLFKPVRRSELPERAAEPRSEQELPNKLQPNDPKKNVQPDCDILVYGSVAMDLSCDFKPHAERANSLQKIGGTETNESLSPELYTSNIATITPSVGGVGYNVALAAHRAGGNLFVRLCSLVADDVAGNEILNAMKAESLDSNCIITMPSKPTLDSNENFSRTAQYVAINDTKKDLVIAMSDMSLFERSLPRHWPVYNHRRGARWTVVDANWPPKKIRNLMANSGSSKVAFEPVSVAKSARLFEIDDQNTDSVDVFPKNLLDLATPNQYELASMYASAKKHGFFESDRWWQIIDAFGIPSSGARDRFVSLTSSKMTDEGIPLQTVQLLPFIPNIITKLGADGVLLTKLLKPNDYRLTEPAAAPYILSRTSNGSTEVGGVYMRLFPGLGPVDDVVSVNGVGDTFLGVLVAGMTKGLEMERVVNIAQRGAVMTLRSSEAVSPELGNIAKVLAGMAD